MDAVEDPRCGGKVGHQLTDILVIAICAMTACAESWNDIALYGRNKLPSLKTFLDLPKRHSFARHGPARVHAD